MAFCEHCQGQRFDRAQVLRSLRATRRQVRRSHAAVHALDVAIQAVRTLEIPHLDIEEDQPSGDRVH